MKKSSINEEEFNNRKKPFKDMNKIDPTLITTVLFLLVEEKILLSDPFCKK